MAAIDAADAIGTGESEWVTAHEALAGRQVSRHLGNIRRDFRAGVSTRLEADVRARRIIRRARMAEDLREGILLVLDRHTDYSL